jgi:hypothetical protein
VPQSATFRKWLSPSVQCGHRSSESGSRSKPAGERGGSRSSKTLFLAALASDGGQRRPGIAKRDPDIRVLLRLAFDEAVASLESRQDVFCLVVENEFAAVRSGGLIDKRCFVGSVAAPERESICRQAYHARGRVCKSGPVRHVTVPGPPRVGSLVRRSKSGRCLSNGGAETVG